MKITIKKAFRVFDGAGKLEGKDEKFDYAAKKLGKKLQNGFDKFNESLEEARIDNCSVDDKNNIIRDAKGNYVFTKDNLKALNKKAASLQETEIEFEPYFASSVPSLTEDETELFAGILIAVPVEEKQDAEVKTEE